MKSSQRTLSALSGLVFFIFIAKAEKPVDAPGNPRDEAWAELVQLANQDIPETKNGAIGLDRVDAQNDSASAAAKIATRWKAVAAKLHAFSQDHADDNRAAEARRLEALLLLNAGFYQKEAAGGQRDQIVQAVRSDKALSVAARFDIALLAENLRLIDQYFDSPAARAKEEETRLRALVAEFPDSSRPYEALLSFARGCSDEQALSILRFIIASGATDDLRREAQEFQDRFSVLGKSIAPILSPALAAVKQTAEAGRPIIVYSWASWHPGSVYLARRLAKEAPAQAILVGVNLESDVTKAREFARSQDLPGIQIDNADSAASVLTAQLKLVPDSGIIIADKTGAIVTVTGDVNFAAKLQAIN